MQTNVANSSLPFEDHLRHSARHVRMAMAEALGDVGSDVTRPQSMARQLGLDKNLAWKISRIVTDDDVLATVTHLPGRSGVRILLNALTRMGASSKSLQSVRAAIAELDEVVKLHCGDRGTLEIMLGQLGRDSQVSTDEAARKKAFIGNSAIWGVQTRARIAADFIAPTPGSDLKLDMAFTSALIDFRRLRTNTPWAIATLRRYADDGTPMPIPPYEPVDTGIAEGAAPLMREFCSQPIPPLSIVPAQQGAVRFELADGPVGKTANLSCVAGWIMRGAGIRYRIPEDSTAEYHCALNTPAEVFIQDLFVHRSIEFAFPPSVHLYSQMPGGPIYPSCGRDQGELQLREPLISLGCPPDVVTPEMPNYRKFAQTVTDRLGWPLDEFVGYRIKVRYPPIPTVILYRHELPERPAHSGK